METEELLKQAQGMQKAFNNLTDGKFTEVAQEIARISLLSFTGELLTKALAVCKSLVEFEDELTKNAGNK